ncbi:eukaryotic membrane protein family-domain-containing protein [Pelagophyceae sp. CCMP2097]|nr:eukaryotic membrane protein family-domain-containing protein [Pelagophyceae sp. CCMP2097]
MAEEDAVAFGRAVRSRVARAAAAAVSDGEVSPNRRGEKTWGDLSVETRAPRKNSHSSPPRPRAPSGSAPTSPARSPSKRLSRGASLSTSSLLPETHKLHFVDASPRRRLEPPAPRASASLRSLWAFVTHEALSELHSAGLDDSVPAAIDNFLAVPARFERFMGFALLVSFDTFLQTVTFLPLRALVALFALACALPREATRGMGLASDHKSDLAAWKRRWSRVNPVGNWRGAGFSLLDVTILTVHECLRLVPMSRAYHWIRGQNTIKLYVIIGIMEVFDRLACVLGQDALDSFYLTAKHFDSTKRFVALRRILLFHFVVNLVVLGHALLYYTHLTTLNVVVNASEDSALVALLISNNFSEIKSTVFKKYNADNLFQVSCSDVCERIKLLLFLALLVLLSWAQVAGEAIKATPKEGFTIVASQAIFVVADWMKHAFVAKFNKIDAKVYDSYADRLAKDVVTGRGGGGLALDHTHAVTRRLGFAVLPLACVCVRYVSISAGWLALSLDLSRSAVCLITFAFLLNVFLLKILTSILLVAASLSVLSRTKLQQQQQLARVDQRGAASRLVAAAALASPSPNTMPNAMPNARSFFD